MSIARRSLIETLVGLVSVLYALPAAGQDPAVLSVRPGPAVGLNEVPVEKWFPDERTGYVTRTMHEVDQLVIPRYRQGTKQSRLSINKSHSWGPAGSVVGFGPDSLIVGKQNSKTDPQPIIVTEDFFAKGGIWWSSSAPDTSKPAAVMQPSVRDISVSGPITHGRDWATAGYVSDYDPSCIGPDKNWPDRWHGIFLRGTGPRVDNVDINYIAGTALWVVPGVPGGGGGRWYDARLKADVRRIAISRAYRGLLYEYTDGVLGTCDIKGCRDFGVKLTGSAINVDGQVHCYGIRHREIDADDSRASRTGTAVWIVGQGCRGGPWYPETADVGLRIDSSGCHLHTILTHTCLYDCIRLNGTGNTLSMVTVDNPASGTQEVGIANHGQANTLNDATVYVPPKSDGIVLNGNDGSYRFRLHRGVLVVGEGGRGIKVTGKLQKSVLDVHIQAIESGANGVTGIDFSGGSIGDNNVIRVTTGDIAGNLQPQTAVALPPGWSTTPTVTNDEVYINGVRFYPPQDEF